MQRLQPNVGRLCASNSKTAYPCTAQAALAAASITLVVGRSSRSRCIACSAHAIPLSKATGSGLQVVAFHQAPLKRVSCPPAAAQASMRPESGLLQKTSPPATGGYPFYGADVIITKWTQTIVVGFAASQLVGLGVFSALKQAPKLWQLLGGWRPQAEWLAIFGSLLTVSASIVWLVQMVAKRGNRPPAAAQAYDPPDEHPPTGPYLAAGVVIHWACIMLAAAVLSVGVVTAVAQAPKLWQFLGDWGTVAGWVAMTLSLFGLSWTVVWLLQTALQLHQEMKQRLTQLEQQIQQDRQERKQDEQARKQERRQDKQARKQERRQDKQEHNEQFDRLFHFDRRLGLVEQQQQQQQAVVLRAVLAKLGENQSNPAEG